MFNTTYDFGRTKLYFMQNFPLHIERLAWHAVNLFNVVFHAGFSSSYRATRLACGEPLQCCISCNIFLSKGMVGGVFLHFVQESGALPVF